MSLEAFIATFGYLGIFLLMFVINVVPAFMPPTWLFLSTLYFLFPQYFHPVLLVFTGAFASSFGRFVLSYMGSASRRMMREKRRRSMDRVGQALRSKKTCWFYSFPFLRFESIAQQLLLSHVGGDKMSILQYLSRLLAGSPHILLDYDQHRSSCISIVNGYFD